MPHIVARLRLRRVPAHPVRLPGADSIVMRPLKDHLPGMIAPCPVKATAAQFVHLARWALVACQALDFVGWD